MFLSNGTNIFSCIYPVRSHYNLVRSGSGQATFPHLRICTVFSSRGQSSSRCFVTHSWDVWHPSKILGATLYCSGDFLALTFYFSLSSSFLSLYLTVKFLEICCLSLHCFLLNTSPLASLTFALRGPRWCDTLPLVLARPGSTILYQNPSSAFVLPYGLQGWLILISWACWFVL